MSMNGYFARVTMCSGTTRVDFGSDYSTDILGSGVAAGCGLGDEVAGIWAEPWARIKGTRVSRQRLRTRERRRVLMAGNIARVEKRAGVMRVLLLQPQQRLFQPRQRRFDVGPGDGAGAEAEPAVVR